MITANRVAQVHVSNPEGNPRAIVSSKDGLVGPCLWRVLAFFALLLPGAGQSLAGAQSQEMRVEAALGRIAAQVEREAFATHELCARCHLGSPRALALRDGDGYDVSPVRMWRGTMMANAFRDPYWRAQLAREVELHPGETEELHSVCTRCHAPMAWRDDRFKGRAHRSPQELASDPLAQDGISCTLCHQISPEGLGSEESFSSGYHLPNVGVIYGPYGRPFAMPMRRMSGYTPTEGPHIRSSALCGSCHTLVLDHGETEFAEQAPYLEWRNSVYSTERETPLENARPTSCQECHMPNVGSMRIAHHPRGGDFGGLAERPDVRSHAFVGGNAWMLDLLRHEAARFGLGDRVAELALAAASTRYQLAHDTARVEILGAEVLEGEGGPEVRVDVRVTNLTGHKLPTGYPSRRAWLFFEAGVGDQTVFRSGGLDAQGRLEGVSDELAIPHYDVIRSASEVAVYESIAQDAEGRVTTSLAAMRAWKKDSRLLPLGWDSAAPGLERIRPRGLGDDAGEGGDFSGGSDVVTYLFPLVLGDPQGAEGEGGPDSNALLERPLRLRAQLRYQSIPPAWVDGLRGSETGPAVEFLSLYDARTAAFEVLGTAETELMR